MTPTNQIPGQLPGQTPAPRSIYPAASARNMALLVQLRWVAAAGQLIAIWVSVSVLGLRLEIAPLVAVPVLMIVINGITLLLDRGRVGYSHVELLGALTLDMLALAWQIYFSGGTANPFTFLFLMQIVIGAILLPPSWSGIVAGMAALIVARLAFAHRPVILPAGTFDGYMELFQLGNLVCFLLMAVLLVFFVIRMDRNRRQSEAALATLRQEAAEEQHIVRLGLLASGAAHELGTPMATMSVILGDWQRHPAIAADPDLRDEVQDMASELRRCKAILSGILMSAGEARGDNPQITTLGEFLGTIADEWNERCHGAVHFINKVESERPIVADPALRQIIGNVIDNALEVSPHLVEFRAEMDGGDIRLTVLDRGPGFAPELLASFGRPYNSTKGREGGGLGLFLVVNVIRKLGGRVEVNNRATGGAVVRLVIPMASLAYRTGE